MHPQGVYLHQIRRLRMRRVRSISLMVCLLLLSGLMSGCAPTITDIPQTAIYEHIPLKKYSDKGFLFTPFAYPGKYRTIGVVSVVVFPEAHYREPEVTSETGIAKVGGWNIRRIYADAPLDSIYKWAVDSGADAVVNFQVSLERIPVNLGSPSYLDLKGIRVNGLAIKRID